MAARYDAQLAEVAGIQTPVVAPGHTSVYAQYTILAQQRDAICAALKAQGIPSVAYYTRPLHLQGAFADLGHRKGDFPVAEQVADRCLSLPMSPCLQRDAQQRVVAALLGSDPGSPMNKHSKNRAMPFIDFGHPTLKASTGADINKWMNFRRNGDHQHEEKFSYYYRAGSGWCLYCELSCANGLP